MAEHIARHDPSHALALVAAGRATLEQHRPVVQHGDDQPWCASCAPEHDSAPWPCPTVRAFGAIWAGHPAWREEWKA